MVTLFVSFTFSAKAQQSHLDLSLQYLHFAKGGLVNGKDYANQNTLNILPTIGYYFPIHKKLGLGINIGKNFEHYEVHTSDVLVADPNYYYETSNRLIYKSFYASVAAYTELYFKNYYINLAVLLSTEAVYNRKQIQSNKLYHVPTDNYQTEDFSTIVWPKIYLVGIYINPSFYRRIYKDIYLGFNIKMGIINDFRTGYGENTTRHLENNIVTRSAYKKEKYNSMLLSKFDDVLFGINILYMLGKNKKDIHAEALR